ncbi:MAG: hypothetical protein GY749_20550 [Desulfobacteraceae bacterium]|nr:hypothetical protein [Desulfobacteraceae bacterium]
MLRKIVSGGQTGADRAALDVAIKLEIPHGGWIAKGRSAEDGALPSLYQLKEMSSANLADRTEQNVIDSDGTLIISHGKLSGGSLYTQEMTLKHGSPCLHIDLDMTYAFNAARNISNWIAENKIETLNVAGPRISKDPEIYNAVFDILEAAVYMGLIGTNILDPLTATHKKPEKVYNPKTLEQAVEILISKMTLKEKNRLANTPEDELATLSLSTSIRSEFLGNGNEALMESCREAAGDDNLQKNDVSIVIVKELWKKLQETNVLRIVK